MSEYGIGTSSLSMCVTKANDRLRINISRGKDRIMCGRQFKVWEIKRNYVHTFSIDLGRHIIVVKSPLGMRDLCV
jgi:hypothetical protein